MLGGESWVDRLGAGNKLQFAETFMAASPRDPEQRGDARGYCYSSIIA